MLRIALLNSIRTYGGGEKRVLRGAAEFARRGHQVTVLGHPRGELAARCREGTVSFSPLPGGRYYSPAAWKRLARELCRLQSDFAVCYEERSARLAALAAPLARRSREAPPPAVVYYYGLENSFKNKPYNRWLVGPRIQRYVANAEALRLELLSFGWISGERVRVIHDGVDPGPIDRADPAGAREELGCGPDEVVILAASRLVPEKGHGHLLEAAAPLCAAYPALRLWIAGEGPEEERLRGRARELGLGDRVRLLGFRRDLPRLLLAADIFCHPSRREGAPNAVREAMAAGLPVAAVAASGTPELVLHDRTGFLAAVGDVFGLRRHLEALITDPELRRRLGEAGRARALTEFSEERCAERWLQLLEECRTCASQP